MSKTVVQSYLCRPFCSFFRAGTKEEMACQGALVLSELLQRGRLAPEDLPAAEEEAQPRWQKEDQEMEKVLCRPCPFAKDGCDFHSVRRSPATEPCGGYLLLQLLRDSGMITGAELEVAPAGATHVA